MTAPGHSDTRSKLAYSRGLGRQQGSPEPVGVKPTVEAATEKAKRAGQPRKAEIDGGS